MIAPAMLVAATLLGQSSSLFPGRVVVNSPDTKVLHVTADTAATTIKVNGVAIPLYPGTTGIDAPPDADVDSYRDYVVAWRAAVPHNGVTYETICLSVNGGPALVPTDSGGNPVAADTPPRVTTGQAPGSPSPMPITVAWTAGGTTYAQAFQGYPATASVTQRSLPLAVSASYTYSSYTTHVGDISSADNGDFVVSYRRTGMAYFGPGLPTGIVVHGFAYATLAERFGERSMTQGNSGGMIYSFSEVACFHDGHFVVAFNNGQALMSESFSVLGVPIAGSANTLAYLNGTSGLYLSLTGQSGNGDNAIPPTNFSLACKRNDANKYEVTWCSYVNPNTNPTGMAYASNGLLQKVINYVPQPAIFVTTYNNINYPGAYSKVTGTSTSMADDGTIYLDYQRQDYPSGGGAASIFLVNYVTAF